METRTTWPALSKILDKRFSWSLVKRLFTVDFDYILAFMSNHDTPSREASAVHSEWVKYPTGKIAKGDWCDWCKRYNVRNSTADVIAVWDNRILMIQRGQDPQAGWWALPAGYVGWDETLEEAAARELKEEVGLTAETIELLGVYSDPKRDLDGRQNMAHVFVVKVSGDVIRNEEEVRKIQWFDLDDLPKEIAFDHRNMIEDYKRKYALEHKR